MREIKFKEYAKRRSGISKELSWVCIGTYHPFTGITTKYGHMFTEYTGVKTKNGTEIYVDDIVSLPTYQEEGVDLYIVEIHGGAFQISDYRSILEEYDNYDGDYNYHHGDLVNPNRFDLVVVGNIHENPELLST